MKPRSVRGKLVQSDVRSDDVWLEYKPAGDGWRGFVRKSTPEPFVKGQSYQIRLHNKQMLTVKLVDVSSNKRTGQFVSDATPQVAAKA